MKFEIRDILMLVLVGLLSWQMFFQKNIEEKPQPITITIPERTGTTGTQIVEKVVPVPTYIPQYKQPIEVDSKYKELYEKAQDSIQRMNLYLEAIKINDYEEKLVDNDTIEITGYAKTRGSLLEYKVDYNIKPFEHTYDPEVIIRRPSLSMGLGVEAGIPTFPNNSNFLLKGNLYFENKKGNALSVGYDTDKRIWLGLHKNFKLKK